MDLPAAHFSGAVNWYALGALAAVLFLAMFLTTWAAATLGNPRPLPRRPLPYPRHKRNPTHAVPDQAIKPHLASGYVVTRKMRSWRKP